MTLSVERLGAADRNAAIDVLSAAFHDYAVMRYVLRDAGDAYGTQLRSLVGFFCDKRLTRDWPLLGVRDDAGGLAAVAGVNLPGPSTMPAAMSESLSSLRQAIGDAALARLDGYEEESDLDAPAGAHHFLGIIGTRPERQGSGCGGALMRAVIALARSDATSSGVCLNTEQATNVAFYRRFGFEVIAERDVREIHTWCLFHSTRD